MNQASTTYRSDFSYDWIQNNFTSDTYEFCSPDNIDQCLKYICQEFHALGFPSIYSTSNDCPFAVNCDIVKLLNAIYELLRSCNDQTQTKEDLESRNQRLSADLIVLNKKNNQMKNSIEQLERKLASALERERQCKEKIEQLTQSLKTEKEETKRLATQVRQQKIAYQHEIRKHENNQNLIKAKLNQLLKAPNKVTASMSISQPLSRNTGQRGKWKTSSTASSAIEDMYSSVISNYETRCKDTYKEILLLRQYLQSVLLQTMDVVSILKGNNSEADNSSVTEEFALSIMNNECRDLSSFDEKFTHLFTVLKKIAKNRGTVANSDLEKEVASLKSKMAEYERLFAKLEGSRLDNESFKNASVMNSFNDKAEKMCLEQIIKEKKELDADKLAVAKSFELIEKEKAKVTVQKLAVLKLAMQQKNPTSMWHQGLNPLPSLSVITSRDGSTRIPNINQLRISSSSPDHVGPSSWNLHEPLLDKFLQSKSDSVLTVNPTVNQVNLPVCSANIECANSDLPSWAVNGSSHPEVVENGIKNDLSETSQNISTAEIEPACNPSTEESLLSLKSAILDIERRRNGLS